MKKIFLAFFLILFSVTISAQEKNYIYCELVGVQKWASTKVTVRADFGDGLSSYIRNSKGKLVTPTSMTGAMNHMSSQGWVLVQTYSVTDEKTPTEHHWVLRKEVSRQELEESLSN